MGIKSYKLNLGKYVSIELKSVINATLQELLAYQAEQITEHCNLVAQKSYTPYAPFLSPVPQSKELNLLIVSTLSLSSGNYELEHKPEGLFPGQSIFAPNKELGERVDKEIIDAFCEVFRTEAQKAFLTEALVVQANFFAKQEEMLEECSRQEIDKLIGAVSPKAILLLGGKDDDLEDLAVDLPLETGYRVFEGELKHFQLRLFLTEEAQHELYTLIQLTEDGMPVLEAIQD